MANNKKRRVKTELDRFEKIKRLVLIAMFSDDGLMERLVLKGGNALNLVYGIDLRGSVDIDFSMPDDIPPSEIKSFFQTVERVLKETFRPEGLEVFDVRMDEKPERLTSDVADFWGGYQIEFKLTEKEKYERYSANLDALRRNAVQLGQGTKFSIQISKFEYTAEKTAKDLEGFRIYVYSPEMLVAEKLRAVCQQMKEYAPVINRGRDSAARARDFFDIHAVTEHFKLKMSSTENCDLVSKVFKAKRVPLELLAMIPKYRELHEQDFEAVKQTVKLGKKVEEFSFYFNYYGGH